LKSKFKSLKVRINKSMFKLKILNMKSLNLCTTLYFLSVLHWLWGGGVTVIRRRRGGVLGDFSYFFSGVLTRSWRVLRSKSDRNRNRIVSPSSCQTQFAIRLCHMQRSVAAAATRFSTLTCHTQKHTPPMLFYFFFAFFFSSA